MRKAGILLPVASLPSDYGIGDFGPKAYEFLRYAKAAGFKIWQILPLNPLGFGNSPYQPYSSKAMDELYISLDLLKEEGLIADVKCFNSNATVIDYEAVRKFKHLYLVEAFHNFEKTNEYEEFIQQEWVYDYAVFLTLKKANNNSLWVNWPKSDKSWIKNHKKNLKKYQIDIEFEMFVQYILFTQWNKLREFANKLKIQILGDIPIYVGIDSLDVWAYQKGFLLDREGNPKFIAGVPPDYFSATGQRWGNPIYNWKQLEKDNFEFWLDRLNYSSKLFDIIRIDHFRAFDTYWKIPASCPTAIDGKWVEAPGYKLFDKIYETYPDIQIVAEDLGDLRPEVLILRDHYGLKGMRVVEYSFDPFEPKNMPDTENLVAYTGTHDNEMLSNWLNSQDPKYLKAMHAFFKKKRLKYDNDLDNMLQYTLSSKAEYAIIPMGDLLGLPAECRINTPGTVGNPNWQWKMNDFKPFLDRVELTKHMIKRAKR